MQSPGGRVAVSQVAKRELFVIRRVGGLGWLVDAIFIYSSRPPFYGSRLPSLNGLLL